jgi:signal peptidase I
MGKKHLFMISAVILLAAGAVFLRIMFGIYKMPSDSMIPTIPMGNRIVVNKLVYLNKGPERGDVVVFISPEDKNNLYVKRIVGLPGESVEIRDGKIFIDRKAVDSAILKGFYYHNAGEYGKGEVSIPKGSYYLLGDNSVNSRDSRYFGVVPARNIIGRVVLMRRF